MMEALRFLGICFGVSCLLAAGGAFLGTDTMRQYQSCQWIPMERTFAEQKRFLERSLAGGRSIDVTTDGCSAFELKVTSWNPEPKR